MWEILKAAGQVMGLEIVVNLGPWNQVRDDLEQGRIDILTGMYYSPERDEKVDFSTPHILVTHGIFVRKGSPIRTLEDLQDKDIIVQDGDIMDDYAVQNNLSPTLTRVKDQIDALRLLASGKHDAALIAKLQGRYLIYKYDLSNIETAGPPILPRKYCFAVKEGNWRLLVQLNEGLSILKATGRYDEIYEKWFRGVPGTKFSNWHHLRYFLIFLIPLVLLLIGAFFMVLVP